MRPIYLTWRLSGREESLHIFDAALGLLTRKAGRNTLTVVESA